MLKYLASVKFAIVLLILIVAASIVGTLIPQNWSAERYSAKYGETRYGLLENLQLTDVFHSYWFTALLAVFCLNLCLCSARGFVPLMRSLRQSNSTAGRVDLRDLPFYEKVKLDADAADVEEIILKTRNILARSLYRLKYADLEHGVYYFERGKIGRLGPLITHASIVIILIGGIFVARFGFSDYRSIPVGETIDVPHSDFQVRVDDFRMEFYPNSRTPREYTSKLTIIQYGVPRLTKTTEVNHPMKYKGVKFYQSGYGLMDAADSMNVVEIELSKEGEVMGKFKLGVGNMFRAPNSQLRIKVVSMEPDFVIGAFGNVSSRSRNLNNPAVFLELYDGDELEISSWSFLKHPEFRSPKQSDYSLRLVSIDVAPQRYYTRLQISRDPGLPIIWVGCLLMVVGMFLSFYLPFKRVWVRLSADGVEMGGRSYKNRAGFEREFDKLTQRLLT